MEILRLGSVPNLYSAQRQASGQPEMLPSDQFEPSQAQARAGPTPTGGQPPLPGVPGPMGAIVELIGKGYSFHRLEWVNGSQKVTEQLSAEQVAELPEKPPGGFQPQGIVVSKPSGGPARREPAPGKLKLFDTTPMAIQHMEVSSLQDIGTLSALEKGQLDSPHAQTLKRLQDAGVELMVADGSWEPGVNEWGHERRSLDLMDSFGGGFRQEFRPPSQSGIYGAERRLARGWTSGLWLRGPQATELTRLPSLVHAAFFYLGEPHPELDQNPQARQLRDLGQLGVQFIARKLTHSLGGRFAQTEALDALGAFNALRSNGHGQFDLALEGVGLTSVERDEQGLLQVPAAFLEVAAQQSTFPEAERRIMIEVALLPTGEQLTEKLATYARLAELNPKQALSDMKLLAGTGQPPRTEAFLALRADQKLHPEWIAGAVQHEGHAELVPLGRLGGKSFAESRQADAVLRASGKPYPEALAVYSALYEKLPQAPLELTATLLEKGYAADLFLRERALSGDSAQALLCLQPGGHPTMPEKLEVREEALRALEAERPQSMKSEALEDYRFLMTLPQRNLPEDATTLGQLTTCLRGADPQGLMKRYKAGELGRCSSEELLDRVETELYLTGDRKQAAQNVQLPPAPYEQRKLLAERMQQLAGDDKDLVQGPDVGERLSALERLRGCVTDPDECRKAFRAITEAHSDGAWQGRTLDETLQSFLGVYLTRDLRSAIGALKDGPRELGNVAGVQVANGALTVGGVRLRTRL